MLRSGVGFRRHRLDADRLAVDQAGVGQSLQHPGDDGCVGLHIAQARAREIVKWSGGASGNTKPRNSRSAKRIRLPARDRALGVRPFEVSPSAADGSSGLVAKLADPRPRCAVAVLKRPAISLGDAARGRSRVFPIDTRRHITAIRSDPRPFASVVGGVTPAPIKRAASPSTKTATFCCHTNRSSRFGL